GDAGYAASNPQPLSPHCSFSSEHLVLAVHHPHVHAYLTGQFLSLSLPHLQAGPRISGILQRHPCMLQKQPLLRVDVFRFFRRYVEEQRIELIHPGNKAAPLAVMMATPGTVFTEVLAPLPALFWNFDDAVFSSVQVLP